MDKIRDCPIVFQVKKINILILSCLALLVEHVYNYDIKTWIKLQFCYSHSNYV